MARDELPSAGSGPEPFGLEPFGLELMAERLVEGGRVGGRWPFHDVSMGETAALSLSKGMRSPASPKRDVNTS